MDTVSLSCAGVAPRSALLSHSFADAAIARALHFSLSDHAPAEPPAATTMLMHGAVAGTDCPGPAMAAAPSPSSSARCRLGPAGGHGGKRRRPRPSKRAPTTYISTDAATFRAMVQRVTGADEADLLQPPQQQQDGGLGIGLFLPHLGVEQFLLAAGHAPHVAAAAAPYATATPAAAAAEQQPLFPTLDSWNVMYGKKNEVVSALTASP
ncbi:calmodulin-binding protein 25-like [Miscanthus floridulus]|uniref:calmodulin-binding protein 25-like n=1 Tax=Miscanthus floridulus TaxID=154761 RepID=UPI0034589D08